MEIDVNKKTLDAFKKRENIEKIIIKEVKKQVMYILEDQGKEGLTGYRILEYLQRNVNRNFREKEVVYGLEELTNEKVLGSKSNNAGWIRNTYFIK